MYKFNEALSTNFDIVPFCNVSDVTSVTLFDQFASTFGIVVYIAGSKSLVLVYLSEKIYFFEIVWLGHHFFGNDKMW